MSESYRQCPKFNLGENECCGASHEESRKSFWILKEFNFQDGGVLTTNVYDISDTYAEPQGNWVTAIKENSTITELYKQMTYESQKEANDIHPTFQISPIDKDCPLFNQNIVTSEE